MLSTLLQCKFAPQLVRPPRHTILHINNQYSTQHFSSRSEQNWDNTIGGSDLHASELVFTLTIAESVLIPPEGGHPILAISFFPPVFPFMLPSV
jgi:hypothetical protein